MCPPSTYGKMKQRYSFDSKGKSLHINHKFTTADKAQLCDGRNWESCRDATNVDAVKSSKMHKVHPVAPKKMVVNDNNGGDTAVKAFIDAVNPKSSPSIPQDEDGADRAAGTDDKMIRIMSSYKPRRSSSSSRTNLASLGAQQQREETKCRQNDTSKQKKRPSIGDIILAHADNASGVQQGSCQGSDDSSASAHVPSNPSRDGTRSSRRRNSSSSNTKRSSRSSDERRRGSAGRRRHSNEDKVSSSARIPRNSGKASRRASLDSNTASAPSSAALTGSDPSRVTVRKLSAPMHRCTTTNKKTVGIMRPARYSSNNLAAMANENSPQSSERKTLPHLGEECVRSNENNNKTREGYQPMRRRSIETHPPNLFVSLGLSSVLGTPSPQKSTSTEGLNMLNRKGSKMRRNKSMVDMKMGNANWVASGVEFSKSMEVYLFQK